MKDKIKPSLFCGHDQGSLLFSDDLVSKKDGICDRKRTGVNYRQEKHRLWRRDRLESYATNNQPLSPNVYQVRYSRL
jgi:hypothetical protein